MQRLAALVPAARGHLVRYHGVLAPGARWRRHVVRDRSDLAPEPPPAQGSAGEAQQSKRSPEQELELRERRLTWAQLLQRVFLVDILECLEVCPRAARPAAAGSVQPRSRWPIRGRGASLAILDPINWPALLPKGPLFYLSASLPLAAPDRSAPICSLLHHRVRLVLEPSPSSTARPSGGARVGSPSLARNATIAAGSVTTAMSRRRPPQRPHSRTSVANTRSMRSDQVSRRSRSSAVGGVIVLAMLFSPEVSLGSLGTRDLAIRLEDLLIPLLVLAWLGRKALGIERQELRFDLVFVPMLLFLSLQALVTMAGWGIYHVNLTTAVFYVLKQAEYYAIFFFILQYIDSERKTRAVITLAGVGTRSSSVAPVLTNSRSRARILIGSGSGNARPGTRESPLRHAGGHLMHSHLSPQFRIGRSTFMVGALAVLALSPPAGRAHTAEDPLVTDLIAGGGNPKGATDAGDVRIWNDEDYLYVGFVTSGDSVPGCGTNAWCLTETHVHVEEDPELIPAQNGNPAPGQFDYGRVYSCAYGDTYQIPLAWAPGTDIVVAAHAVVRIRCGKKTRTETAWGNDIPFPGSNWATYVRYTVQSMGPTVAPGGDLRKGTGVRYRDPGNRASGGDVYLGRPDLGVGGNRVERALTWVVPGTNSFSFTWDPAADSIVTVVNGGTPLVYGNVSGTNLNMTSRSACPPAEWDRLVLSVWSRNGNCTNYPPLAYGLRGVTLDDPSTPGNPDFLLGDFAGVDKTISNWLVTGFDFSQGFTVAGLIEDLSPQVDHCQSSELNKIEIYVGAPVDATP